MERPHDFRGPVHFLFFRLGGGPIAGGCVEVAGGPTSLANVPLIEVGDLRGQRAGATPGCVQHGGQAAAPRGPHGVAEGSRGGRGRFAVYLHVLPQGARMGVRLVAASDLAVVGLVAGVDVRVFLPITAVGKLPVTAIEFTFERLFPCNKTQERLTMVFQASHWRKPWNRTRGASPLVNSDFQSPS